MKCLKKLLNPLKKELKNAIVIELAKDLNDLAIDPAALLDLGNLSSIAVEED